MNQSSIVVCQNKRDVPASTSAIVLSEVITQFDEAEANDIRNDLENLDISHDYDAPVYRIVANHVWGGSHLHGSSPRSMELLILLYQYVADHVSPQTEEIRCVGVSGRYLDLIADLAENEGLEFVVSDTEPKSTTMRSITARSVVWLVISLFDLFVSLLLRPFFSQENTTLVKYPVFRPDTFRPIENHSSIDSDSVFTLLTVSYFTKVRSLTEGDTTIIPIRCLSTLSGSAAGYKLALELLYDSIFTDHVETAVVAAVEAETDINLEHTVTSLTKRAILSNISAYLLYHECYTMFDKQRYESVLLTTGGPTGRAVAVSATEHGLDVYNLPHGVTAQPVGIDKSLYKKKFKEGDIVHCELPHREPKFVSVGLPKHILIQEKRSSIPERSDTKTLLIGTTYIKGMRKEFVRDVVPLVVDQTDWEVVIKTHPKENCSFYRDILSEAGINAELDKRVTVTDADLYSWIGRCHLLLTTVSNVGIESVILGTPAASYNPWSPNLRDPLWAKHGSVPSLQKPSEIIIMLNNMTVEGEIARQEKMLDDLYLVRNNSLEKIATKIQREITEPDQEARTGQLES